MRAFLNHIKIQLNEENSLICNIDYKFQNTFHFIKLVQLIHYAHFSPSQNDAITFILCKKVQGQDSQFHFMLIEPNELHIHRLNVI